MRITPLDIRHKEFTRGMRGYKDAEVDEFLDDITEEYERLFNENIDYNERLEALQEKISQYQNIEDTLQKTLISAQQQAEELKQNAQKEADLILRDAELKSRSIVNDSYAERQKIQRSVQALKQKHEDLRYQLRKIIENYANILDQDIDALEEMAEAEGGEQPAAEGAPEMPGVDDAVSMELMEEVRDEKTAAEDFRDDAVTADKAPVSMQESEDPFADVEIDTDEDRFKW
jgi:cell division initiation protein